MPVVETKPSNKVLIVDDVPKNIQILGNILSRENYQIAYAQYGEQALSILEKQTFDLILLDIMMPGMDGYEVCKRLKSKEKTKGIPIIFLTAKADMESVVKGFESGGQDYITKPFNSAELLARVKMHIELNTRRKQLKELNRTLEDKVKKRTLQLQEANRRLGVLDKAKSDFLSIISHELRTPLNGVVGLTNLLAQTELDEEQEEYIRFLKESSDRLMNFSEIALLITSLRVERYEPELLPVAINNVIEAAIYELNEQENKAVPAIHVAIEKGVGLVLAESELIKKSLMLILKNSLQYAGRKRPIDISVFRETTMLHISIDDSGPGFNKESMNHLFEVFAANNLMHGEGMGLSLSAVKLIMDIHGGEIHINNRENNGAHVELTLSLAEPLNE